jgi:hypothetical protein
MRFAVIIDEESYHCGHDSQPACLLVSRSVTSAFCTLDAWPLDAQLNVYPGLKGMKEILGTVPSWIQYEERERVEVRHIPATSSALVCRLRLHLR